MHARRGGSREAGKPGSATEEHVDWISYSRAGTKFESRRRREFLILHRTELTRLKYHDHKHRGREFGDIPQRKLDVDRVAKYPVIITSYDTVRDYQFSLANIDWSAVIVDEAQKIKNPTALVTIAAKALKARFRIASTGTPVENSLSDLWCIMDFVCPGKLDCLKNFMKEFEPKKDEDFGTLSERMRILALSLNG